MCLKGREIWRGSYSDKEIDSLPQSPSRSEQDQSEPAAQARSHLPHEWQGTTA